MAVEAKNYPIFGTMNHPETQNLRAFGDLSYVLPGRVNTESTDAINFYFSQLMFDESIKNLATHKF